MPLYDFICVECKTRTEKLVKMDTDKIECPHCQEIAIKAIPEGSSVSNFHLKGTGWYATDFGGKTARKKGD